MDWSKVTKEAMEARSSLLRRPSVTMLKHHSSVKWRLQSVLFTLHVFVNYCDENSILMEAPIADLISSPQRTALVTSPGNLL